MRPSLGFRRDLLRAQVGHPELSQQLLLTTNAGLVLPLRGRDSLLVLHGERFQLGLPGRLANCLTPRIELLSVLGVVGHPTLVVADPANRTSSSPVEREIDLFLLDPALRTCSGEIRHHAGKIVRGNGERKLATVEESGRERFHE